MTFYERVKSLCDQRGISVSKLVSDLGYSTSTGTSWKASSNMPRPGTIKKVADYLGMTIDELKSGIDYIDYDSIDTSSFNQSVFKHLLEQHGGNEKKAIKAYLDFEKAQAQDALSEQPPIFQNYANNIHNSNVVQGDNVSSTNHTEKILTDNEKELLRLFSKLGIVDQARVLAYVADLKEKGGKA